MSILNKLTEGIVDRDLSKEGAALLTKWERTGLLEGIDNVAEPPVNMAYLCVVQGPDLLVDIIGELLVGILQTALMPGRLFGDPGAGCCRRLGEIHCRRVVLLGPCLGRIPRFVWAAETDEE